MPSDTNRAVPVWTIAASASNVDRAATLFDDSEGLTEARIAQLRGMLTAYANSPIVTVEARPLPKTISFDKGMTYDAASPLAQQLTTLLVDTAHASPDVISQLQAHGETLYRMVVPAEVAADFGAGLLKSMPSKAIQGAIRSPILDGSGVVAQASFVPVSASAGAEAGGLGAITVAGPLVLFAVAVALSVHAEQQRLQALARITALLEKIRQDAIDSERDRLNACQSAVKKATAILLDNGTVGHSLGLDSATYAIDTAIEAATRRVRAWQDAVSRLPDRPQLHDLRLAVPGVDDLNSEFRGHLELAALAISLKRRIVVLQALEHAQLSGGNKFLPFVRELGQEQDGIDQLEAGIKELLDSLGELRLRSPGRLLDVLMTRGQVEELLDAVANLRELAANSAPTLPPAAEVEIEMVRRTDGSVIVLPPQRLA